MEQHQHPKQRISKLLFILVILCIVNVVLSLVVIGYIYYLSQPEAAQTAVGESEGSLLASVSASTLVSALRARGASEDGHEEEQGVVTGNKNLYVQKNTAVSNYSNANLDMNSEERMKLEIIASQPRAMWVLPYHENDISYLATQIEAAESQQRIPVVVVYGTPSIVCEEYEENRDEIRKKYLDWVEAVQATIDDAEAIIILEPDATGLSWCLFNEKKESNLLSEAVRILKQSPKTKVYIDAGHAYWVREDEMIDRLVNSNIEAADGFSLNVSNFISTEDNISYGTRLSNVLNGKHFIIDTSRNGRGPTENFEWCNPRGRALGELPTLETEHPLVDAFLWVKQPGESDGYCNGGPVAGEFWLEYTLELVENSSHWQ